MISLKQLQRLSKLRPLTAKEKAILCYWNRADGKFTLANSSSKMSDMLLSFNNVYSDQELESVISPMASEDEANDFFYWTGIINLTLDYDLKSNIFFQKTISLLNEKSLSFYKLPRIEIMAKRYSITLNKEVDVFEINDEISNSFIMFYRLLVYTITNHILLSNAFSPKDDFFCVKALIHMTDIRKNMSDDNSCSGLINGLIVMLQKENQKLINDYLDYVKRKYTIRYFWNYISDQWRISKIIESVGDVINLYYPTRPIPKSKEDTIFSEIKKLTHSDT
jgi:hypothetical protein